MAKDLYDRDKVARHVFEEASDMIHLDLKKLCFDTDMNELTRTENAQPAILTASYAAYRVFMKEGLKPSFMAGHSLGEITALTCAGAISFKDAIRLVRARGLLMQRVAEKSLGNMVAIRGAGVEAIQQLCEAYSVNGKIAVISNYNSTDQIVISGDKEAVVQVGEAVERQNGKYTALQVSAPFHSPLLQEAVGQFRNELIKYTYRDLQCPVISNRTARPYHGPEQIVPSLSEHLVRPVLWKTTVDYFVDHDVGFVVELGPKNILRNLVTHCTDRIEAFSYDDRNDSFYRFMDEITGKSAAALEAQKELESSLRTHINLLKELSRYHQTGWRTMKETGADLNRVTPVTLCLAGAVCVPNQNPNEQEYQTGVVEPYRKVRKMQAVIEQEERMPREEEIEEAFQMLLSVFKTKKVPICEQQLQMELICERLIPKEEALY